MVRGRADSLKRLAIGWWNTSLSPPMGPHANNEKTELAVMVVRWLVEVLGIQCLALGEVSHSDVELLAERTEIDSIDYYAESSGERRKRFGLGLLYDRECVSVLGPPEGIREQHGGSNFKIALQFDLLVGGSARPLHLLVSHWRSRRSIDIDASHRQLFGIALRDRVRNLHKLYEDDPFVVLVGDYNDEPFDSPLVSMLLASRDRRLVTRKSFHLYNPFWRWLGESEPHVPGQTAPSVTGTHFFTGKQETNWYTYDQMIFSRAFLGGSEWELDERLVQVFDLSLCDGIPEQAASEFDHFPVASVIEKVGQRRS